MIPRGYITAWRQYAPWSDDAQVEQDLVIERALQEIYNDDYLKERLVFRGGTALHKVHLSPAARYSEDLDFVQLKDEQIGETLGRLRNALAFLGKAQHKYTERDHKLLFRFESEIPPVRKMRLKIEINCREIKPITRMSSFDRVLDSDYYRSNAEVLTYQTTELLATKVRALYQRRKGRDLFDLWYAEQHLSPDWTEVVSILKRYLAPHEVVIDRVDFESNIKQKLEKDDFRNDMKTLIRPEIDYSIERAGEFVLDAIASKL